MAVRRLRWQGPARTEACRVRLVGLLEAWRDAWCTGSGDISLEPALEGEVPDVEWRGAARLGGAIWLGCPQGDEARLGTLLAGQDGPDFGGIAARLAVRALEDLLARLTDASPEPAGKPGEPESDADFIRHGGIAFSLTGVLAGYRLLVDATACDRLVPPLPPARVDIASLDEAVRTQEIALSAVVPLGEQALAQSMTLQVGDVLLAGPLSAATVRLAAATGQELAAGVLTRVGDARGIRIDRSLDN
ncbi:MAG: hypothetical protein K0M64_04380 [Rhizobium sp.]|nr:hypothetical protein [Rhizobium sp.]